ncbi:P-loop containing nucleoside triphosphate hydrolase protein [Sarocladium strictum]
MVAFDKQPWIRPQFGQDFAIFVDTSIIKRISALNRLFGRRPHPLSTFVFTDARWGDEDIIAIQAALKRVSDMLKGRKLPWTYAAFQFMSFGDDEDGIKHLYTLDASPRINPLAENNLLTDHQYFLCDGSVEAFIFKVRDWQVLRVDGIQPATYDQTLFERLVLKESNKQCIQSLTQMYMKGSIDSQQKKEEQYTKISEAHIKHTTKKSVTTWSADSIEGKGEGLILLLHGQPGSISEFVQRPLLSLTCADIGVDPATVEKRLIRWFMLAQDWGAIVLIDEADIYMEQRSVQDIQRNHLVAGFLRSLEYYKGMVFLTTNRVGTFDEAFMSRIHTKIHYPNFEEDDRQKLWDSFFQKLEGDRETTMRITQSAKDYVSSQDLRSLKWNGREIRNAFQVAVALAEAQGNKDDKGRVLIKLEHIRATVQMSKEFQDYLLKLRRADLSKRTSQMGNRYDAYGKEVEKTDKH